MLISGIVLLTVLSAAPAVPTETVAASEEWSGPETVGTIDSPQVTEASGLACSRRAPDLYWTHNDSGGEPVLYAIDGTGHLHGSVRVKGASNRDWEDIASFKIDQRAYLIAADVGDNSSRRTDCVLYVIAEPDPATLNPEHEIAAEIAWKIPVRFPEGPRDCESVAVDVAERTIYLISKRTKPPVVYRLPLMPQRPDVPVAVRVGELRGIAARNSPWGIFEFIRSLPCGLDISVDGRRAAVVTYGSVYVYDRGEGESWAAAFGGQPSVLTGHGLDQAEGVCFSADGRAILVTSEGPHPPLVRYTLGDQP